MNALHFVPLHMSYRKGSFSARFLSFFLIQLVVPNVNDLYLNRGVNDGFKPNTQSHLAPVLATSVKVVV